jgi:hypothetical protein
MPPPFSLSVDIKKLKTPPHSFLPAEQGNKLATSSLCVPCHRSLSTSLPHTAARFSIYPPGRQAHGAAAEHGGPTQSTPSFPIGSSFPNGAQAPDSTFFNSIRCRCARLEVMCLCVWCGHAELRPEQTPGAEQAICGSRRLGLGMARSTTGGGAWIRGGRGWISPSLVGSRCHHSS